MWGDTPDDFLMAARLLYPITCVEITGLSPQNGDETLQRAIVNLLHGFGKSYLIEEQYFSTLLIKEFR